MTLEETAPSFNNCRDDLWTLMYTTQSVQVARNQTMEVRGLSLLLDAAGKPPAGLLQGGYWSFRGNMEECQLINNSLKHSSEMSYGYINFTLRVRQEVNNVTLPTLYMSEEVCLPSSCNTSVVPLLKFVLDVMLRSIGLYADTIEATYTGLSMKAQPLTAGAIVMIIVCSFILFMVLVGTIVDKMSPAIKGWRKIPVRSRLCHAPLEHMGSDHPDVPGNPLLDHKKPNHCEDFLFEFFTAFSRGY